MPRDPEARESPSVDAAFHRLVGARELALAYELLARFRGELGAWLSRGFGDSLGGEAAVEQVLGDSLRKAILKAYQYDPGRGSVRTWLFRIAQNTALDEIADARRIVTGVSARLADQPSPEADDRAELEELQRAIHELPRRERVILKARYRKRPLPDRKLSEVLGCSVGHVHNVRSRVLRELRSKMREDR